MRETKSRASHGGEVEPVTTAECRESRILPIDSIVPDEANRKIDEADEEFCSLLDSIKVLGLLCPIHVQALGDRYQIIDGERRWRACRRAGITELTCEVWPSSANLRETLVAGVVLNEQRQAHRCIHVARRLRELKMAGGLSGEQVAARTGITLDRVKTYLCLFGGSEFLLEFFESHDVPVRVAAEMIRYEKATNEARARKLAARYLETPLGVADVQRLRKRDTAGEDAAERTGTSRPRSSVASLERAWRRDPAAALAELEILLHGLGYGLVLLDDPVAQSNEVSSRSSGGR